MKVTNIKNIVIWALVIINAFFLAFFLWRLADDHSQKAEALENLGTLLSQNGIYIDTDNIHEGDALPALLVSRNIQRERRLAETLLGQTQVTEQGGIIYTYSVPGKDDKAVFKNGGEFDITFSPHVYDITINEVTTVKSLLRTMKIETTSVKATGVPGNETVTAVCSWNHQPIFNCQIIFIFKDGSLNQIVGKHTNEITVTSTNTDMSSSATAMINFLGAVKAGSISCTEIKKLEPGYNLNALGTRISPAWRIETDTDTYYIDAVTGTIERDTR